MGWCLWQPKACIRHYRSPDTPLSYFRNRQYKLAIKARTAARGHVSYGCYESSLSKRLCSDQVMSLSLLQKPYRQQHQMTGLEPRTSSPTARSAQPLSHCCITLHSLLLISRVSIFNANTVSKFNANRQHYPATNQPSLPRHQSLSQKTANKLLIVLL